MSVEEKLREALGEKYKLWHTKEVEMLIKKGYKEDIAIKSYVKRVNKKK